MFVEHKEVGEVIEAPARIAKLSEAIRIGARLRKQCQGKYFADGGSCALGAAWEATMRGTPPKGAPQAVRQMGFIVPMDIIFSIVLQNDTGESREQIADWVERQGF